MSEFEVVVGAGTLRAPEGGAVRFDHRWTSDGVTVHADFTGAHLLHLAVAGCVLNDVFREGERLGIPVRGVRVTASGGFDTNTWQSSGISYAVAIDSPASADQQDALLETVDFVAEIPKAIRTSGTVARSRA